MLLCSKQSSLMAKTIAEGGNSLHEGPLQGVDQEGGDNDAISSDGNVGDDNRLGRSVVWSGWDSDGEDVGKGRGRTASRLPPFQRTCFH